MCPEGRKEKKDEAACCTPEKCRSMSGMMGKSGFDCSSMMEMMKNRSCCDPETEHGKSGSNRDSKSSCC